MAAASPFWRRPLPLLLALLAAAAPCAAASYPPGLRFHTLANDRVSVHFHDGFEAMARQTVSLASELLAAHERRYGQKVGRVQIVLADAQDESNGFASPLPYPLVTLRAIAPNGDDTFGVHEGWLRLVLSHELAHLVHLEQARGLWRAGRSLLGRAPFLFPNSLAMSWMIEGLATYEETELTAFGRGRNPDSRMVLRMAALEGQFPSEDRAIYAFEAWPGGQAPYLFGEAFLRWLSEKTGEDALPRIARQHASQFPPWLDGRSVGKATGAGLHAQWQAWAAKLTGEFTLEAAARRAQGLTGSTAITTRGIRQAGPRFSPDGSQLAYTSGTLTRFPEIRLARVDGSADRRLALRNGGSALSWTPDGRELVYAELQAHHTFAFFSDLSALDVASGRTRRLTRGARAYDPDVAPDGSRVVFARKLGDRSDLFTVGLDGKGLAPLTRSAAGVEWSSPRWSPTGDAIVAARLLPGGWLDLVSVDPATGAVVQLTHDRAKDVEPSFTPDGAAVVFRSDRDGISNIYRLRLGDRSLTRVSNVLGGAFQPAVSPDGSRLAFSDYSARGFDIRVAPLAEASETPAVPYVDDRPPPRPDAPAFDGPVQPYRPWATLWPRFWSPWLSLGSDENRFGVATGGSDPLFRHLWGLRGSYGSVSGRVNASGFYEYDRFRVTLLATGQDTTDVAGDGLVRTLRGDFQAALPIRRTIRTVQTLSLTYRRERQQALGGSGPDSRVNLGGVEVAWLLASARSYAMSVSPVDGGQLRLAWLHENQALGSDVSLEKLTADARWYQRLFGERDVLALRLGGGATLGEPRFARSFAVGGYPDASLFDVVRTNPAVLRGYAQNALAGRSFVGANLEYRFPFFSPQRGWRSLPVFLRHLHGSVFLDAADAWSGEWSGGALKKAAGASIGLDSAVGFSLPVTAEVTMARGLDSLGFTKVYLRFGLAF